MLLLVVCEWTNPTHQNARPARSGGRTVGLILNGCRFCWESDCRNPSCLAKYAEEERELERLKLAAEKARQQARLEKRQAMIANTVPIADFYADNCSQCPSLKTCKAATTIKAYIDAGNNTIRMSPCDLKGRD